MLIKKLLKDTESSAKRWNGNIFNCNSRNKYDTFCFDSISSTHQSMPELVLKTEFEKEKTIAFICFNNGKAKNGNIIFGVHEDIVSRTIANAKYSRVFKIVFENAQEDELLWDDLKTEITTHKLVVDIFDIRSFKPVGVYTPIKSKKKNKAKTTRKQAT